MDGRTIMGNLENKFWGLERLVFTADLYKETYGGSYIIDRALNAAK